MYHTANLELITMNDEKIKKDVNDLIKSYEEKISEMRLQISNHKKIKEELSENYKIKLENMQQEIEISMKNLSENKIKSEMWKEIRDSENKIRSDLEEKYESKIKIYENKLEEETKKHNDYIKRSENSALIG